MSEKIVPITAKIDKPMRLFGTKVRPSEIFANSIGNTYPPEVLESYGWCFAVGDPEFWTFSDRLVVPGGRALDLGGGNGRSAIPFALRGMDVTTYDISKNAIKVLNALTKAYDFLPITARKEDIITADFEREAYDTVLLAQTFVHFENKKDAYTVLDKAVDATKPGGHIWIRVGGKEDEGYAEFQEGAVYYPDYVEQVNEDVFTAPCGCSGEEIIEPFLFFDQTELLQYAVVNGLRVVHSQLMPSTDGANILFGEDFKKGAEPHTFGLVTLLLQKPE